MRLAKLLAVVLLAMAVFCTDAEGLQNSEEDILIIVNKSVSEKNLSADKLRTIFLKQRTTWGSGKKIFPINAKSNSELRSVFRKKVLGMTAADEGAYWRDEKIRRGLLPPAEFKQTLRAVFEIRDGVSYLFRRDYKEGAARIVTVIPAK